jgi:hypothetical protein
MLKPEVGPDSLPREAPVIAYTEKVSLFSLSLSLSLSLSIIIVIITEFIYFNVNHCYFLDNRRRATSIKEVSFTLLVYLDL